MKRITILISLIVSFALAIGQTAFTVSDGVITWAEGSDTISISDGYVSSYKGPKIIEASGRTVKGLNSSDGTWGGHSINGVTYETFKPFAEALTANGFGFGGSVNGYAPMDYADAITSGLVDGVSVVDKFGYNPEITAASAPEEIWEFSEPYNYDADSTAPISYISSSSALDVGQPISVQGLDISGYLVTQTAISNGQSVVTLDTPLYRVFRMINISQTEDINGVLYCHTSPTVTNGVPPDISVRAIINGDNNQTLMAIYTIPRGFVGKLRRGEFMVGLEGNTGALAENTDIIYKSRRYGQLFTLKKIVKLMIGGSPVYQDLRPYPDVIPSLTDIAIIVESTTATVGASSTFHIELIEERKFPVSFLEAIGQIGY